MHGLPSILELVLMLALFSLPIWLPAVLLAIYFWRKSRRKHRSTK